MRNIVPSPQGATSIRRGHQSQERREDNLLSAATYFLRAAGVEKSKSWVSRTVEAYRAMPVEGIPLGVFLAARVEMNAQQRRRIAERADLRYLLSYSDPTGETAVRNIMRERSA